MTPPPQQHAQWPGLFVSFDGPGGVGKSTVLSLLANILQSDKLAVHATTQPSRTALGDHIRHGTHTYQGMALACLVAGDRHHQLEPKSCLRSTPGRLCCATATCHRRSCSSGLTG